MELVLKKMLLDNFKGVRHLEADFQPGVTRVGGRNGAGKTTMADAFFWVLLNKDSAGNAPGTDNFREKPLDENGEEIHNLETAVELICLLDGEPFTMKRVQREVWTKTRGRAEEKFGGNESVYFINGVQMKVGEFKNRVAGICDDALLPSVAMLGAFNRLPWQDRRKLLLRMSGADVDAELLRSDAYSELANELNVRGVSIDDLKRVLQSSLRDLNAELKLYPARIDEAKRSLPEFADYEVADAKEAAETLPASLRALDERILRLMQGSDAAAAMAEAEAVRAEISAVKARLTTEHTRARRELEEEAAAAARKLGRLNEDQLLRKQRWERATLRLNEKNAERDRLRQLYREEYSKKFVPPEVADVCPTCGQPTPAAYRDKLLTAASESFAQTKRGKLMSIQERGKAAVEEIDLLQNVHDSLKTEIEETEKQIENAREHCVQADAALDGYPTAPDFAGDERLQELTKRMTALEERAANGEEDQIAALQQEKADKQAALIRAQATLAKAENGRATQVRIVELQLQQKHVGDEAARIEKQIMLTEQFVQDRCALLESSINGMFPTVRWKLFNRQINGGIADCCMCMIPCGGMLVPYGNDEDSHAANTAARLHADAEIADTIGKMHEVRLPLFFDGGERVNEVPNIGGQLITLTVTNDSSIRIAD